MPSNNMNHTDTDKAKLSLGGVIWFALVRELTFPEIAFLTLQHKAQLRISLEEGQFLHLLDWQLY